MALRLRRGTPQDHPVVEIPLEAVPARRAVYDTAGPRQTAAAAAPGSGTG
ncbi:hypothetical protein OG390_16975 [Streptomyces sp. NBC_00996]|nr:hypothetical protein OG390_16975 [Streptomyces sp. NBC_00996]